MPNRNPESTVFAYYPDGDIDPLSRKTRMDLILDGGQWKILGGKPLTPEDLKRIMDSVEKGRGEIQKIMSGRRRVDGKADLLGCTPRFPDRRAA